MTRSPARRRPARCATCWPGRSAAPGCWSPSSSPSLAFVLVTVAGRRRRRATSSGRLPVRGRSRCRQATSASRARSLTPRAARRADRARDRLRRRLDARRGGVRAVLLHADRLAAAAPRWARWRSSSASSLLFTLDAASPLAPYLPTRYWLAFVDLFRDPILWRDVSRGIALQAVYVGVLLAAAWANFTTKDVTS